MADTTLDMNEIQELLAGSRTKGAGDDVLKAFNESNEVGIEVDLTSGPFAGKDAGNVVTALNNAKARTIKGDGPNAGDLVYPWAKQIQVIKRNKGSKDNPEWHVYLIDKSKVEV